MEGKDFKPGTSRITAHTDETLITLLMTSPGMLHFIFRDSSVGLKRYCCHSCPCCATQPGKSRMHAAVARHSCYHFLYLSYSDIPRMLSLHRLCRPGAGCGQGWQGC